MITLQKLVESLRDSGQQVQEAGTDCPVASVTSDSRQAQPGTLFVALKGEREDGHAYVKEAFKRGCCAVVVEKNGACLDREAVIRVSDTHRAYGHLAAAFYGHPAREITLIGLTGTNGKTTTSWILEDLLITAGKRPGVIGTVNYRYHDREGSTVVSDAPLTTPEPIMLHGLLRKMSNAGVTHVVMEVSSHALVQQRLAGMQFDMGVFTNLSRDHLDYHKTMDAYFMAKQKLFVEYLTPDGTAVIVDDNEGIGEKNGWGKKLIQALKTNGFSRYGGKNQQGRTIITCGLHEDCTVWAGNIEQDINGFTGDFVLGSRKKISVQSGQIGRHNVLNMLTAAGIGAGLRFKPSVIRQGLQKVGQIPGRLERVMLPSGTHTQNLPEVFVDYAHTPDGLENVLQTLRPLTRGRLFCVFGCGGDRDRGKRPMMGQIAGKYADRVVLTSDNPRSEDPESIISEIEPGLPKLSVQRVDLAALLDRSLKGKKYSVIEDRHQAIHSVCAAAGSEDVVLIAGKGHETYQITADGKRFFDDRVEAKNSRLRWTADSLLAATSGHLVQSGKTFLLGEASTDTRTLEPGDIFLALSGENYNGHDFISAALDRGAAAVIISESPRVVDSGVTVVKVADTLKALGDLAHYRRQALAPEVRVIGITGSSGKTTVKEMTAGIFEVHFGDSSREQVLKTMGNLNNLIGLPLSLLKAHAGHRTAVLEMGMNRPGEIERLAGIAEPDIGCITNVQAAHLEGLGSIEGVARAKGELFASMSDQGIRVINFDDPQIRKLRGLYGNHVIGFAVTPVGRRFQPAVRATRIISLGELGMRFTLHINRWRQRFSIPATGEHNVANCAAAAAIATAAGIEPEVIVQGLMRYSSGDKRLQIVELPGGIRVVNDSYNANPASMAAALRTVSGFGSDCRRVAVLGDMLELGSGAAEAHRKTGALVAELGFDYLAALGNFAAAVAGAAEKSGMEQAKTLTAGTPEEIAAWLNGLIGKEKLRGGDWILLKGSRGMRMEKILTALESLMTPDRNR